MLDKTWKGLESVSDQIIAGTLRSPEVFHSIVDNHRKIFEDYMGSGMNI